MDMLRITVKGFSVCMPVYFQDTDVSFWFTQRKIGQGQKVCIIKQSQSSVDMVDHCLSSDSAKWFEEVLLLQESSLVPI